MPAAASSAPLRRIDTVRSIPLEPGTRRRTRRVRSCARFAAVVAAGLVACGCQTRVQDLGYIPDPDALAQIKSGVQSKVEVAQLLGTPSTTAMFGEETWLYITARREAYAFFKPEITEQDVVAIAFNEAGVVDSVNSYVLKDGVAVNPVNQTTPTYGKQLTMLQQLLGNIGRFNGESNNKPSGGKPGTGSGS
jgi:outer membrane protein assembly factor BamE (lipoprotein component of BamABCDE complex)